jgi:predicted transcriptional regulator
MKTDAILMSIRPVYVERILAGTKTVELRRVCPKVSPGQVMLIYASSPMKAIVAWCTVGGIEYGAPAELWPKVRLRAGIEKGEYRDYFEGASVAAGIGLKSVRKFERAMTLQAIQSQWPAFRAPQSYRYLSATLSADGARLVTIDLEGKSTQRYGR